MKRLAIITTHPIQYNAPLFSMLHQRNNIQVKVFYTWGETVLKEKFDPGFGKKVEWDIPLLEGYEYSFADNIAGDPGSHHFRGIDNPALIEQVKKWNADAILVYGWAFKSHLRLIRAFHKKIPVFFRGDSTSLQYIAPVRRLIRRFYLGWVYKHIDQALYVGTHNMNYYKQFGIKDGQLVFAPHAVDNKRFEKESEKNIEQTNAWKASIGINPTDIVFLYAGKLDENKNVKLLLKAFTAVSRKGHHLIIAGNGPTEKELINSFAKDPSVHFLPFQNQSQMPLLYSLADVFVLPSLSETWGLSINEAMACGKAVLVSSACGAAIDLVKEGENGFVFRSNDMSNLQQKLNSMSDSKAMLKDMGARSQQIIASWTFEKTCKAIEDIMEMHS